MASSSETADNFVLLKVIYFLKIVNLKDGQFLKVLVKVYIRYIIIVLHNPYPNGLMYSCMAKKTTVKFQDSQDIGSNMDLHLLFIHFSFKLLKFLN